jgi:hypothetical protein
MSDLELRRFGPAAKVKTMQRRIAERLIPSCDDCTGKPEYAESPSPGRSGHPRSCGDIVLVLFLTGLRTQVGLMTETRDWAAVCRDHCSRVVRQIRPQPCGSATGRLGLARSCIAGAANGVLSPGLFSKLVIMAILTTLATIPMCRP